MYKAIIFDFFDTIAADFYRVWLNNNGHERTGEFLRLAQAADSGDINLAEYYQRLSSLSEQPAETIRLEFETQTQINQPMLQLISHLHHNYQVGLLTNSPQDLVHIILKNNHLEKYFDEIIISGEVGLSKPDPRIYELTLGRMNVAASDTVFVDDLPDYIEGARKAGIRGILFQNVDKLKTDLEKLGVR